MDLQRVKPIPAIVLLVGLCCIAVAVILWRGAGQQSASRDAPAPGSREATRTDEGRTPLAGSLETRLEDESRESDASAEGAARTAEARDRESSSGQPEIPDVAGGVSWPVVSDARTSSGGNAAPGGEPDVDAELAFLSLRYVGVDPAAEKTWLRAVNDPRMPAETRSDLIEDLNQEGYTDNRRPTKEDLPLILARLELIERLAPFAMDEVNAAAFEEAYKDLLNMYVRLGGKPREKK